jgi:hypothetical protein
MRTLMKWLGVFAGATAIDLFVRFGLPFQMTTVLVAEAILFPVTGFVFLWLLRRSPGKVGFPRRLQLLTIAAFFLAGLRAGLWASGVPIGMANIAVLMVAVLAWLSFRRARRAGAIGGS